MMEEIPEKMLEACSGNQRARLLEFAMAKGLAEISALRYLVEIGLQHYGYGYKLEGRNGRD